MADQGLSSLSHQNLMRVGYKRGEVEPDKVLKWQSPFGECYTFRPTPGTVMIAWWDTNSKVHTATSTPTPTPTSNQTAVHTGRTRTQRERYRDVSAYNTYNTEAFGSMVSLHTGVHSHNVGGQPSQPTSDLHTQVAETEDVRTLPTKTVVEKSIGARHDLTKLYQNTWLWQTVTIDQLHSQRNVNTELVKLVDLMSIIGLDTISMISVWSFLKFIGSGETWLLEQLVSSAFDNRVLRDPIFDDIYELAQFIYNTDSAHQDDRILIEILWYIYRFVELPVFTEGHTLTYSLDIFAEKMLEPSEIEWMRTGVNKVFMYRRALLVLGQRKEHIIDILYFHTKLALMVEGGSKPTEMHNSYSDHRCVSDSICKEAKLESIDNIYEYYALNPNSTFGKLSDSDKDKGLITFTKTIYCDTCKKQAKWKFNFNNVSIMEKGPLYYFHCSVHNSDECLSCSKKRKTYKY